LKKKKRFNFGLLLVIFGTYKFRKKFIVDSIDIRGIKQGEQGEENEKTGFTFFNI